MIIDITGIALIPGNLGNDCPGNGEHFDESGSPIECCCDECNYYFCCVDEGYPNNCAVCMDEDCPRAEKAVEK